MEYEEHSQADENFYIVANKLINLSSRAWELFESSEAEEKQQLLNFLLQNPYLQGKNALFELKNPFSGILEYAKSGSVLPLVDAFRTANWASIKNELEFSGILKLFPAL